MLMKQKVTVFVGNQMKRFYADKYDMEGKKYIEVDVFDLNDNNRSKVDILCDYCKKNVFQREYRLHKRLRQENPNLKDSCPDCKPLKIKDNFREIMPDLKEIRYAFSERHYTLLSTEYINAHTHLEYICQIHTDEGIQQVSWMSFYSSNYNCKTCQNERKSAYMKENWSDIFKDWSPHTKKTFEEAEVIFQENGFLLHSQTYKSNKVHLECTCIYHPENEPLYLRLDTVSSKGHVCKYCGSEKRKGENSPLWKGGVTLVHAQIRVSLPYKQWVLNVFNRDDFTCQACGNRHHLRAHHILNFSEHESLRFDINNGITLCRWCHDLHVPGSFHHTFGTNMNDLQQLNKYLDLRRHETDFYQVVQTYVRRTTKRPPQAKFNDDQVRDIRRKLAAGIPVKQIAEEYGVNHQVISDIKSFRKYRGVDSEAFAAYEKPENHRPSFSSFTDEQVLEIRKKIASGATDCELADEYNVKKYTINNIRNNRRYQNVK